jgi:hypothetical protein
MAQLSSDSQAVAIWRYIIAALKAEMNVGPGGPGTGPNAGGRLQTVQYVHGTIHLWSDVLPTIGVQILVEHRKPEFQRVQDVIIEFKLVVAAQAKPDPTNGITLDSAYDVLNPLLADGAGNGVLNVLSDRGNVQAGGLANFSRVGRVEYDWEVDKAVGATDARAYAYIQYLVETQVIY